MAESNFKNPVVRWIDSRLPVFTLMNHEYVVFPMPRNCNYFWSFGAMATITLLIMIMTGVFLAMSYAPTAGAFDAVERIMRDVNYGWLLRYVHANGASMFFMVTYIHMFRGLYFGSYKAPREILWIVGVLILLTMMATAFMGYVLPWGQMSLWGATVITNFFTAFPVIGDPIVMWLWGGYGVDIPTLNRFFALHFLLPFVLLGLVLLHVAALHAGGSNNPLGIDVKGPQDTLPFHPYFTTKDGFALVLFFMVFAGFVFFAPNFLGHPDNYIPANPMQTPPHIVPEWYFLPFYAILRSVTFNIGIPLTDIVLIDSKLGGVLAMFGSIIILLFLPWLDTSPVRSTRFRPIYRWFFWVLVLATLTLGYVGGKPAEAPYIVIGQIATLYYFFHFLILLPVLGYVERTPVLPTSIAQAVLKHGGSLGKRSALESAR